MTEALIIIDIQNDYFPGGNMEVVNSEAAALKAEVLLKEFRAQNKLIVHIQHISTREGATFFLPGTAGVEIHESVRPLDSEKIIIKHYPNSFRGTELEDFLQKNGVNTITFCGMMSHMCIDATVRAAFDNEYTCIIAADACATRILSYDGIDVPAPNVHAAYMAALAAVYAQVISSDEIINQIRAGGTPC